MDAGHVEENEQECASPGVFQASGYGDGRRRDDHGRGQIRKRRGAAGQAIVRHARCRVAGHLGGGRCSVDGGPGANRWGGAERAGGDSDAERAATSQYQQARRQRCVGQHLQPVRRAEGRRDPEQLAHDRPDPAWRMDQRQPELRAERCGAHHRQPGQQPEPLPDPRRAGDRRRPRRTCPGQPVRHLPGWRGLHQYQPRDPDRGPAVLRTRRFAGWLQRQPRPRDRCRGGPQCLESRSGRHHFPRRAGQCGDLREESERDRRREPGESRHACRDADRR